ncbi:hypothetical protein PN462_04880 [Spirulina sp. CS-785/01]|uniref:hypothetical protein n=1 Tax=Spirulina sp. CS-785/01 TaxID=3021716 RepID=UPI00232E3D2E|nr:hypothetical protein [Spirulina sp. CS-785/01]MDB9312430.1 hypothetical protein [Spirulina sp. CS-785/01]
MLNFKLPITHYLLPKLQIIFWILAVMLGFGGDVAWAQSSRGCPREFQPLVEALLVDLPGYANRVALRSRRLEEDAYTYVMMAGKANFEPIDRGVRGETTPTEDNSPQQVFFTTLEQRLTATEAISRQHYHWLFLVKSEGGWRLVTLYTRYGNGEDRGVPSPPEESGQGVIGQAIRLWLRDCRFG